MMGNPPLPFVDPQKALECRVHCGSLMLPVVPLNPYRSPQQALQIATQQPLHYNSQDLGSSKEFHCLFPISVHKEMTVGSRTKLRNTTAAQQPGIQHEKRILGNQSGRKQFEIKLAPLFYVKLQLQVLIFLKRKPHVLAIKQLRLSTSHQLNKELELYSQLNQSLSL